METWKRGEQVRVAYNPSRVDWEGRTGWVLRDAFGINPLLRVRLDPVPHPAGDKAPLREEVDGTADKFERLGKFKKSWTVD